MYFLKIINMKTRSVIFGMPEVLYPSIKWSCFSDSQFHMKANWLYCRRNTYSSSFHFV